MSNPDLPTYLLDALAHPQFRSYHNLWHQVRNQSFWNFHENNNPAYAQSLKDEGWYPDNFAQAPGSGLDFLGMHRGMILMVDMIVAGNPRYPAVTGWVDIPADENDPEFPVPTWDAIPGDFPSFPAAQAAAAAQAVNDAKSATSLATNLDMVRRGFRNAAWLRGRELDEVGIALEWSIHGWMHIRWSAPPPRNPQSTDVSNDWLFQSWSSHVNKLFWKLHGWIDDCIGTWESANGATADFSNAWVGVEPSMPPALPERVRMMSKHMLSDSLHHEFSRQPHASIPMFEDPEIRSRVVESLE